MIARVFDSLVSRGLDLSSASVLDLFSGDGTRQLNRYAPRVGGSLELWEWDQARCESLRRQFPVASVRQGDTYRMVQETPARFDVLVADQPIIAGGARPEGFDLFPHVLRMVKARPTAWFVCNVFTDPQGYENAQGRTSTNDLAGVMTARERFFGRPTPVCTVEQFHQALAPTMEAEGFVAPWWGQFARTPYVSYYAVEWQRAPRVCEGAA